MFGLLRKVNQTSKPPQKDVFYPFKTLPEIEKLIFGEKKQFASNEFDFVQKQRNQWKRQNMLDDDEKRVINGDRPFTKAKRSNCDMFDQNELLTYASLEKMLHKAIFAIQQLKKKGHTNTSSAPKQHELKRCNFSSLSNSDLKTNVFSFDKSKAVKTTRKAHSTRCVKCHRIGHYANKCQNQKPLVTLENENIETKPEKEGLLSIFDNYAHKPMAGSSELIFQFEKNSKKVLNKNEFSGPLNAFDIGAYDLGIGSFVSIQEGSDEEQNRGHQANQDRFSSIQKPDQTQVRVDELDELGELSDTSLELNELNDTSLELNELNDTSLELNEQSDTEDGAGLIAGRNESFSAQGKIHNKFNLGRFYTKFDQAFADGFLPICINKYQQKESKS
uniref:CCHC-type domain-containing protein n=1 Tax=Brassica oleracea var. oleracea TaxID=109376 RepID=A0A0D2ZPL8_BRAOL